MVSFDVMNLFTQVPLADAFQVIEQRLSQDYSLLDRTAIPITQLIELTELCLRPSFFEFQDKYYEHTEGTAMGSPLSPVVANLFMENLKEEAIRSAPLQPKLWRWYLDDTFVIWPHGQEELHRFHEHLNSLHSNIYFTMEEEKECTLPFLDVLITRRSSSLSTSVNHKPTHTERYIHFSSHHHLKIITAVLRCMKIGHTTSVTHNQRSKNCTTWRRSSRGEAFLLDLWRRPYPHHPKNLIHRLHPPSHHKRPCAPHMFEEWARNWKGFVPHWTSVPSSHLSAPWNGHSWKWRTVYQRRRRP